ncbi:acetyltransferase [Paenarthrobacter ureafaciens]|nr:acetyltransferase [Paenarthrobacter ureafaciens]
MVVVGAGGFGREVLDVVEAWNIAHPDERFNVLGVVDDSPSELNLRRLERRGYKHLGGTDSFTAPVDGINYLIGVGNPDIRARIAECCDARGWTPATAVHPSASIGSGSRIGAGTIICGGVQVSTNVRLGRHVNLNPGSVVGHDAALEDFVSVNPGGIVSGDVLVQERVLVGAGAVVLQGRTVGASALVGASACVTKDIEPKLTVVGVPSRPLGRNEK